MFLETNSKNSSDHPIIELSDVWKIFGDAHETAFKAIQKDGLSKAEVLDQYDCVVGVAGVSFSVSRGENFCIMGLSGSGKSTLVRHINRLHMPTAGRVIVDGHDILALDDRELRRVRNHKIAMVFQDFGLLPHRSVRDNVAMPLEIRGFSQNARWEAAERALALVDLVEWRDKFAHELSGGMQQRVGLARAIAADADILLMDEPFSALDPLIRRQLQDEFVRLAAKMNKTTIFITHDLDEAVRIGSRIAIMRDGIIVQMGTPEDIIMQPADKYVADFVAGISRINLIRAHSLATTLDEARAQGVEIPKNAAEMHSEATLKELIVASTQTDGPLIIKTIDGNILGLVTKADLLNGVIAGTQS